MNKFIKKEKWRKKDFLEKRGARPHNLKQAFWLDKCGLGKVSNIVLIMGGIVWKLGGGKPTRFVYRGKIFCELDPAYDWTITHDVNTGQQITTGVLKDR